MKKCTRKITAVAAALAVALTSLPAAAALPQPQANPAAAPQRNLTNFGDALRCFDQQMLRFGIRDVSVMLEDIPDKTSKLGAGTRDMMVSAISDMTRRSRAVKLVAFGVDNQNIVSFLGNLQRQNQFGLIPQYDIRGALSQFDTDIARKQAGIGVSIANLFGFRLARDTTVSVMGFDASVVNTADLTLVNGVTSKNTLVTIREESGIGDGTATIRKAGISFSTSFTRQDSPAQAVRNLIELATIELIGKLVKVPYWTCLGIAADDTEVANEIEDWFIGFRNPRDMNAFMQEQLRNRDFFEGPVNGRSSAALRQAIAAYGKAIGARSDGVIDLAYFRDFLLKDVPRAPDEPFATADLNPEKLGELKIELLSKEPRSGGPLEISVTSTTDAYVYCYSQSADGKIQRFFPNRFARDPRISADQPLTLPGKQPFVLRANASGDAHRIACLSAGRELYDGLPPPLRWSDFNDIGFTNFDDVRQAFANSAKTPINMAQLSVPLPTAGVLNPGGDSLPGVPLGLSGLPAPGTVNAPQTGFAGLPPEPVTSAAAQGGIPGIGGLGIGGLPPGGVPAIGSGSPFPPGGIPAFLHPGIGGALPNGVPAPGIVNGIQAPNGARNATPQVPAGALAPQRPASAAPTAP